MLLKKIEAFFDSEALRASYCKTFGAMWEIRGQMAAGPPGKRTLFL